jgi:hypothetical protein
MSNLTEQLGSGVSRDDECPNCQHVLRFHVIELGCEHGWAEWDEDPKAPQGCDCPLTLAEQFNPPHEGDKR